MRLIQLLLLIGVVTTTRGVAQQAAGPAGNGMGVGNVDRPGGISYVTRRRPTASAMSAASGFFAAGGVQVTAPVARDPGTVGAATTGVSLAGVARTPGGTAGAVTSPGSSQTQVLMNLRRLAAAGNPDAQRALSALSKGGR